jgi:hypothetical protein
MFCLCRGVFEVSRSGKSPDLYTGIQAHLSSCASPKVLDAVNKFLPEISLHEVSRLSTWPSHFHQCGAKEDNIALYFFAKDIERQEYEYYSFVETFDSMLSSTKDTSFFNYLFCY